MNEEKREIVRERLSKSRSYEWLQKIADVMDRYYLDAALGFAIPGGIGDTITAFLSLAFVVYFYYASGLPCMPQLKKRQTASTCRS